MKYKLTVLGYTPAKTWDKINETKIYEIFVSKPEEVQAFFLDICSAENDYNSFQPCILSSFEEIK